jgi:hypothetical protein
MLRDKRGPLVPVEGTGTKGGPLISVDNTNREQGGGHTSVKKSKKIENPREDSKILKIA